MSEGSSFGRTRMRNAHQMNQGVGAIHLILKTLRIERISYHYATCRWQDGCSTVTNQRANLMAARQQRRHQATAKIAAGARNKDVLPRHRDDAGQSIKPAARTECAECARNGQQSLRRG